MDYNMKTIKTSFLIIALIASSSIIMAQPKRQMQEGDHKEQIESMKIGFLTRKLNLTPEEAKTFWPVYNQYQNDLDKIRETRRNEVKNAKKDFMEMSDKDVEKIVDNEIAFRQNEVDILKKYHSQFKQVLPIKKVAILYRSEEEFKRELLKKIQERRGEKGDRKGPPPPDEQ
jgi:Spy/CpxP family protein refolding chaperone